MELNDGLFLIGLLCFVWVVIRAFRRLNQAIDAAAAREKDQKEEYRKDPRYQAGRGAARNGLYLSEAEEGSAPFRLGFEEEREVIKEETRLKNRSRCEKFGDYDD